MEGGGGWRTIVFFEDWFGLYVWLVGIVFGGFGDLEFYLMRFFFKSGSVFKRWRLVLVVFGFIKEELGNLEGILGDLVDVTFFGRKL